MDHYRNLDGRDENNILSGVRGITSGIGCMYFVRGSRACGVCAVTAQRWGGTRRGKGMREDGVGGRKERHRVGDAMGREKRGGRIEGI